MSDLLIERAQSASWMLKYLADRCPHAKGCPQKSGKWGPSSEFSCDCFVGGNYREIRQALVDMAAEIERLRP